MEWLFGKRLTPQERLRKHQRSLERTQRELDRERSKLEQQEKKLIQDIKRAAKQGQMGACQVMAKDLVRTRRYIQKFYQMKTQLQAVSLRIQTVGTNQQMMQSMKGATKVCIVFIVLIFGREILILLTIASPFFFCFQMNIVAVYNEQKYEPSKFTKNCNGV